MTLRITQGILYTSALRNLQRTGLAGFEAKEQVSTGLRVRRPSDDPAATLRILPLRGEIRGAAQSLDLIGAARHAVDSGAATLEDASATLSRLRELTTQAANGTLSETDRRQMAETVDGLLQQMLAHANGSFGGRFLFGGTRTDAAPFELIEDQGGTRIAYRGDGNASELRISETFTTEIDVPGDRIFLARSRGPTLFEGATGAAPSGAADSGVGFGALEITFAGLDVPAGTTGLAPGDASTTALGALDYSWSAGAPPTLSIAGSPPQPIAGGVQSFTVGQGPQTVSLDVSGPVVPPAGTIVSQAHLSTDGGQTRTLVDDYGAPYQVRSSLDGTVVNVDVAQLARVGSERLTFQGTFDPFTALIAVRDILRNEAGEPSNVVTGRLSAILPEIDFAHDAVLRGLQELGGRSHNLELFESRLDRLGFERRAQLSELEDADLAEALVELGKQDLAFQASLQVGARAVQLSLLNFLG